MIVSSCFLEDFLSCFNMTLFLVFIHWGKHSLLKNVTQKLLNYDPWSPSVIKTKHLFWEVAKDRVSPGTLLFIRVQSSSLFPNSGVYSPQEFLGVQFECAYVLKMLRSSDLIARTFIKHSVRIIRNSIKIKFGKHQELWFMVGKVMTWFYSWEAFTLPGSFPLLYSSAFQSDSFSWH